MQFHGLQRKNIERNSITSFERHPNGKFRGEKVRRMYVERLFKIPNQVCFRNWMFAAFEINEAEPFGSFSRKWPNLSKLRNEKKKHFFFSSQIHKLLKLIHLVKNILFVELLSESCIKNCVLTCNWNFGTKGTFDNVTHRRLNCKRCVCLEPNTCDACNYLSI